MRRQRGPAATFRTSRLSFCTPYEVIHLGGQAAAIVPLAEFLRLRARESTASAQALEDAEDAAGAEEWLAREARGKTNYVPLPELRRRLGLAD